MVYCDHIKNFFTFLHFALFSSLIIPLSLSAQEFKADVVIDGRAVSGTNREALISLENELENLLNGNLWSQNTGLRQDVVKTTFTVVLSDNPFPNSYSGELFISAKIESESYSSPIFLWRDREIDFEYHEHQPLNFSLYGANDNLTSIFAFYLYLIMGLTNDIYYEGGGNEFFNNLSVITTQMQGSGYRGWEPQGARRNRFVLASKLHSGTSSDFNYMWHNYHTGLQDLRYGYKTRADKIVKSIEVLKEIKRKDPPSVLITIFGEAKIDELVGVLSGADMDLRNKAYGELLDIFPTKEKELSVLLKY